MAANSDDWTFVKPRSRKTKAKGKGSVPQLPPGAQTSASTPASIKPRTSNLRSVDEIDKEYHTVREQWLDSECSTKLRELVRKQSIKQGSISKAICLGVGTFDPEDGAWAQKRISFHQLIAFTVLVEELEKLNGSEIKCIHQDPIFTESDKGFLIKLGHSVVEDPGAYTEVDEDTFLYGVHLYRPVYAASLETKLPCIFVGTGYDEWEGATMGSLDDIQPMKKMEEEYIKHAFPEDSIQATFYGTSIYWRPKSEVSDSDDKAHLHNIEASRTKATPPDMTEADATSPNNSNSEIEEALASKLAATKIT
ncbi:hypothetical protein NLU13_0062 [Sarocladium strictum]|uniref:SRR1-like domain-containing protein n=1 Tax=Sarocladium strictum TaxID=5046 RepID=A0AA39LAY4_SARSR|nr:hypothetical protein NLU13_0062 [Sarocladium strictum]